ncbi:hypothetical protein F2P81_021737 [Scophthalmus maximus]|uniref:Ig-like domain-containing protein n=1 Tax=Scophthalmus maximus TaxID=52904 RepID=A0A6A4S642_SCOMX|nr:hypothetical protein F2P81_021737 [Scophthalmus maximus]
MKAQALMNSLKLMLTPQPVSVMEDITDQTATEKQSASFECHIRINYPEITLTWYKGTQKLDNSDKYDIGSVGDCHYLKINNCQSKDQGNYRVVCGPHISNAKLTVSDRHKRLLLFNGRPDNTPTLTLSPLRQAFTLRSLFRSRSQKPDAQRSSTCQTKRRHSNVNRSYLCKKPPDVPDASLRAAETESFVFRDSSESFQYEERTEVKVYTKPEPETVHTKTAPEPYQTKTTTAKPELVSTEPKLMVQKPAAPEPKVAKMKPEPEAQKVEPVKKTAEAPAARVPEPPKPEEPVAHPTKAKVTSSTPERPLAQVVSEPKTPDTRKLLAGKPEPEVPLCVPETKPEEQKVLEETKRSAQLPKKVPEEPQQVDKETKMVPEIPKKIPETSKLVPEIQKKFPEEPKQVVVEAKRVPEAPKKIPETPKIVPVVPKKVPEEPKNIEIKEINRVPEASKKVLDTSKLVPVAPKKVPEEPTKTPEAHKMVTPRPAELEKCPEVPQLVTEEPVTHHEEPTPKQIPQAKKPRQQGRYGCKHDKFEHLTD